MPIQSKAAAQSRVDQIASFQSELGLIQQDNIVDLDEQQLKTISEYHHNLVETLCDRFDMDFDARKKKLGLGMLIALFFGALAFSASIFFGFYQFWGFFSTNTQVFILIAAPVMTLLASAFLSTRQKTGYWGKFFGLICVSCFALNLFMLGQIFNITPSPNAIFALAALALLLAYAADSRLLLVIGIVLLAVFISAKLNTWVGDAHWQFVMTRPENFLLIALLLFVVPSIPHYKFFGFDRIYRVLAMLLFFIPVLILSYGFADSYFYQDRDFIEGFYQIIGLTFSAVAIGFGISKGKSELVITGNIFFTMFLYFKLADWWWDVFPMYIFFLLIGLVSVFLWFVFSRLRKVITFKGEAVT